ncbi:MAG: putative phosphoesterase, partial [Candidatus Saccharibacteria bacterium]|nr:putative phosphoesterase [Candidatus Saccharibacteria bacterium]
IVQNEIPFASVMINDSNVSSTGELIYGLSRELSWPFDTTSGSFIMTTILGDTQGLTNAQARASTYRVMAELIDLGVDRPDIEELRKAYSKMPPEIYRYKGKLLERTEFASEGRIATVSIPQEEITKYSALYNPKILVLGDMLQVTDVTVLLIFKTYNDGKVTCAVRCNPGYLIANKIAERFGGGGHPFAAGFKITNGRPFNEVKSECISFATELLDNLEKEHSDETAQHQHA